MPQIPDALAEAERMVQVGAMGNGVAAMAMLSIARDIREMLTIMQGRHDELPNGIRVVDVGRPSAKPAPQKGTGRGRQS